MEDEQICLELEQLPGVQVEHIEFPQTHKAVGTLKPTLLLGAGVRGLPVGPGGAFVSFTAIAVYAEPSAIPYLRSRWGTCSTSQELLTNLDFFMDIITSPMEKLLKVVMLKPLSGAQYSGKVAEGCLSLWKEAGIQEDNNRALEEFKNAFSDRNMAPGSSILFNVSPAGLLIGFSAGNSVPERHEVAEIKSRALAEAFSATIIGKSAVSPQTKASIADRFFNLYLPAVAKTGASDQLTEMEVEGNLFLRSVKAVESEKKLLLAGAGIRGVPIQGKFTPVTTIGIYIDKDMIFNHLQNKWKGKSGEQLNHSDEFITDIVSSPYQKMARVALLYPLTGVEFSAKIAHNSKTILEQSGKFAEAEAKAIEEFTEAFKDENLPARASAMFSVCPSGLVISICKKHGEEQKIKRKIESRLLGEAVLLSMIGKDGVSPHARASVASRLATLFSNSN